MNDRERTTLIQMITNALIQPLPGFLHHWYPELLQATQNVLADALLEAEARGVETGAELTPAICVCPSEEVASSGIHERGCPAGIHRRCRERAAALRAQIRGRDK